MTYLLGAPIVTESEVIRMLSVMDKTQRGTVDYNQFRMFCYERDKVKKLIRHMSDPSVSKMTNILSVKK